MKVLWMTFIPSPYRLRFFEELGKQCELTVLFERQNSKIRQSHWDDFSFNGYEGIILKGVTIGGYDRFCPSVLQYLNRNYDVIVISNPTSPTGIYASALLQIRKISYIVEGDGAFPTNGKGVKMALKRFVMSHAKLCLSTASLHDEYYKECGVIEENIRRYPFTSIGNDDLINAKVLTEDDKKQYKKKLNISEDYMLLSVGRFSYDKGYGKGFDQLLKIADLMRENNIGFYIVGDEPTEEFKALKEKKRLSNVHYIGYKDKGKLAEYYAAADIFVLLTRGDVWGLVINEAMMFGLPIITTDKCIAGLEMIKNGENGYIVSVDDIESTITDIKEIINDQHLRLKMSRSNIEIISGYTYETMSQKHLSIFNEMGG